MKKYEITVFIVLFVVLFAGLIILIASAKRQMPPIVEPTYKVSVTPPESKKLDCTLVKNYKECYQVKE